MEDNRWAGVHCARCGRAGSPRDTFYPVSEHRDDLVCQDCMPGTIKDGWPRHTLPEQGKQ